MKINIRLLKSTVSLLVAVLLICSAGSVNAKDSKGPDKGTGRVSSAPIKVGVVIPFSGGVEIYGAQAKIGLDLAAKEINAGGGILGRKVELVYEDDKTDPLYAPVATRKLLEREDPFALIGPITSSSLKAMVPVATEKKVPMLYATNYEGGACSRYLFAFSTVPNQELAPLLPYLNEKYGNTYFMLGAKKLWPEKMFGTAVPLIKKLGGQCQGTEYREPIETNFKPVIKEIEDKKAKILLFAFKGPGLKSFIDEANQEGMFKHTTVAFLGLSEIDLQVIGDKGQNMFVIVPFLQASSDPSVKKFVSRVKAAAGADTTVSNFVMTHYNALMAMKAAIEKAGKLDREAMIGAMEGITIKTPTGPLTVGKNHHATMNLFLAKTKGTELIPVKALGPIAPEPNCK